MVIRKLLLAVLQVYSWLIVARVILSWVNPRPRNECCCWVIIGSPSPSWASCGPSAPARPRSVSDPGMALDTAPHEVDRPGLVLVWKIELW